MDKDLRAFNSMMKVLDLLYMMRVISHGVWCKAHEEKWNHVRLKSTL